MAVLDLESFGLPAWNDLGGVYAHYQSRGPSFIARWTYAPRSTGQERPEPYWLERGGEIAAPASERPPTDMRGVAEYGFVDFDKRPAWCRLRNQHSEIETEWLWWPTNGTNLRLRFELVEQQPQLAEVIAERTIDDRLVETIAFTDRGQQIHRESYKCDSKGRVTLIASMDGTSSGVEARSLISVDHLADGPRFDVRELGADEESVWPADRALEAATIASAADRVQPTEPAAVADAGAVLIERMSDAVARWYERAPNASAISRLLLLHDWPVNPPFPPAIIARSGSYATGDDPYEFFEPDPDIQAWFDPEPAELNSPDIAAAAAVLNDWFLGAEDERTPLDLYIEVSRAAERHLLERTGQATSVVPVSMDWDYVGIAVIAQLPDDIARPLTAALIGAQNGA